MQFRIFIIIFYVFFSILDCKGQFQYSSKKNKISIPFELSSNLIIIDAEVNNVELKMILDTGSQRNILFSFPENDSIEFYNAQKVKIKGVGFGEYLEAYLSKNNKIEFKNYANTTFEMLLVTDQDISIINKLGIPINGIIGADFFKNHLVEINYQQKKIVIYKNEEKFKKKNKKYKEIDITIKGDRPYVTLNTELLNNELSLNLLIDTGLGDGLWLFENDSIKCKENYFIDVLGRGLGGDIKGKKSRIKSLSIADFKFNEALVSYPDSISKSNLELEKGRVGSLGGEIIKRFNWVLDYKNSKVYIKPNSLFHLPFNYNMSGIELQHNGIEWVKEIVRDETSKNLVNLNEYVFNDDNRKYNYEYKLKPVFEIYAVRKNSPAYFAGLNVGDKIISINGKKAYHYTIQKVTDLFQSEEGKKIEMEVEREGQKLKVEFYLEKIL